VQLRVDDDVDVDDGGKMIAKHAQCLTSLLTTMLRLVD
jgi:hypothetical protein